MQRKNLKILLGLAFPSLFVLQLPQKPAVTGTIVKIQHFTLTNNQVHSCSLLVKQPGKEPQSTDHQTMQTTRCVLESLHRIFCYEMLMK